MYTSDVPTLGEIVGDISGFDWDEANATKNWTHHHVSQSEAEEVFFHRPVLVVDDTSHSLHKRRYAVLGRTAADRLLTVIFTLRRGLIRVVSAHPMSRKERAAYAQVPSEAP